MGCGSPKIKTGVSPGEEEIYKPTGDPKKDFFYCFDDEEIKIIEEKERDLLESEIEKYLKIYNKFKFDYLKELNDTIYLKQYTALIIAKGYTGEYKDKSELKEFDIEKVDVVSCKVNNKEKVQATYTEKEENYVSIGEIAFNITESQKDKQFENLLIIEYTFKIKQKRFLNLKHINFLYDFYSIATNTTIFYYDQNKLKFETKNRKLNISSSKYELKIFNARFFELFLRYNEKFKFSKEEEALIKKKFSSDELTQIISSINKIQIYVNDPVLIFEKVKHIIRKEKDFSSEGKYLLLNTDFFDGDPKLFANNINTNYMITELKVNDKMIPKVEDLNGDCFLANPSGMNEINFVSEDRLVLIEIKTKSAFDEELPNNPDVSMNFRKLFRYKIMNGSSFKYEIESKGINLIFDKENVTYNPVKKGNLYTCSGMFQYIEGEESELGFIIKMEDKEKDFIFSKFLDEFIKNTAPQRIILNKKEHDAYIEEHGEEEGDHGEEEAGEEGEGGYEE